MVLHVFGSCYGLLRVNFKIFLTFIPLVLLPVILAQRPIVDHPVVSEIIERREEPNRISNRYFRYGAWNYPHPGKKAKGGEDAWVASHNFIGVADGVGGWEK